MSEQKMREEFEAWAEDALGLPMNRLRTGGYQSFGMHNAWSAWQASREALVIELPEPYAWDNDGGFEKEYDPDSECSMSLVPKIDVIIAIEAAGVKVKQ